MADRKGPSTGYDFGNKAQYRRTVWSHFRKFFKGQCHDKHALLMPSIEGLEIDVALNNGFRQKNLHIVDMNPAIVATLKRRYPYINTYGVSIEYAVQRIALNNIKISCANFDFTGPLFTTKQLTTIILCTHPEAFTNENIIAITALCGRDDPKLWAMNLESSKRISKSMLSLFQKPWMSQPDIARIVGTVSILENYPLPGSGNDELIMHKLMHAGVKGAIKYLSSSGQWFISTICARIPNEEIQRSISLKDIPVMDIVDITLSSRNRKTSRGRLIFATKYDEY